MVTITIQLQHAESIAAAAASVGRIAAGFGYALVPLVGQTSDAQLQTFFKVEVPDVALAEQFAAVLRQHPAVAAAYIKPADAMP